MSDYELHIFIDDFFCCGRFTNDHKLLVRSAIACNRDVNSGLQMLTFPTQGGTSAEEREKVDAYCRDVFGKSDDCDYWSLWDIIQATGDDASHLNTAKYLAAMIGQIQCANPAIKHLTHIKVAIPFLKDKHFAEVKASLELLQIVTGISHELVDAHEAASTYGLMSHCHPDSKHHLFAVVASIWRNGLACSYWKWKRDSDTPIRLSLQATEHQAAPDQGLLAIHVEEFSDPKNASAFKTYSISDSSDKPISLSDLSFGPIMLIGGKAQNPEVRTAAINAVANALTLGLHVPAHVQNCDEEHWEYKDCLNGFDLLTLKNHVETQNGLGHAEESQEFLTVVRVSFGGITIPVDSLPFPVEIKSNMYESGSCSASSPLRFVIVTEVKAGDAKKIEGKSVVTKPSREAEVMLELPLDAFDVDSNYLIELSQGESGELCVLARAGTRPACLALTTVESKNSGVKMCLMKGGAYLLTVSDEHRSQVSDIKVLRQFVKHHLYHVKSP